MIIISPVVYWFRRQEKKGKRFCANHDFSSEIILSEAEMYAWFEAMEEFRQYWESVDPEGRNLYGKPIDLDMFPETLLSLLSNSGCR